VKILNWNAAVKFWEQQGETTQLNSYKKERGNSKGEERARLKEGGTKLAGRRTTARFQQET